MLVVHGTKKFLDRAGRPDSADERPSTTVLGSWYATVWFPDSADDNGENWALLDNATDRSQVHVGSVLIAGTPRFWSVVRITAVDADGQVHLQQLSDDPAARQLLATDYAG